ncbi:MAG TPA: hypothetical protein VGD58_09315, partial [Herpetosiphonaceae bacterium]
MSTVVFQQASANSPLYYASCDSTVTRTTAYLLPPGVTPPAASLDLSATLSTYDGCYFFLAQAPGDEAAFIGAARTFLGGTGQEETRLAWVHNPNDAHLPWRAFGLPLNSANQIDATTSFDFQSVALVIARGSALSAGQSSLTITAPQANAIYMTTGFGAQRLNVVTSAVTLSLCGATGGSLEYQMQIGQTGGVSDWAHLDVGLRYFYADPNFPSVGNNFFVATQRSPIFHEDDTAVSLYARLSWLFPVTSDFSQPPQTFFSFTPLDGSGSAQPRLSYYLTNFGYAIQLQPLASARLVFASRPQASVSSPSDPLYLTPYGDFKLIAVTNSGQPLANATLNNLMCGLSGIEYIQLGDGSSTPVLSFLPGQPAFAPGFVPQQKPVSTATPLTRLATTSWAYVRSAPSGDTSFTYFAQPNNAPLYAPSSSASHQVLFGDSATDNFLLYKAVQTAVLPGANDGQLPQQAFPVLPYHGGTMDANLPVYEQFELEIASPVRRDIINRIANPHPGKGGDCSAVRNDPNCVLREDDTYGTTPQGLLVRFSSDLVNPIWKQLLFARDENNQQLALNCLDDAIPTGKNLRLALQTNQLLLVISDPTAIACHFTQSQITIAGWLFDLTPATWSAHNTILIFKFYDKPLVDLLKDTTTWSMPNQFNADSAKVIQQLGSYIDDTLSKYQNPATQSDYVYFVETILQNPAWHGVIAINLSVGLNDLPPELAGLAAGIDPSQFFAHHVGVDVTPVARQGAALMIGQSSLFGLIDYSNAIYPEGNDTPYNFKVDTLRVLFRNSQIQDFNSEIEITLDALFGESAVLLDSPTTRNNVILQGRYENQNGNPTYSFSFTGENIFQMPTSVIFNDIAIVKASFSTTVPAGGFKTGDTVQSMFTFWGQMNFQQIPQFDIFSFGTDGGPNDAILYLSFSNLRITMSFPWGTPNQATMTFVPDGMVFDQQASTPRSQSLYAHFPLSITGLVSSLSTTGSGKMPTDLGYLGLQSPLISKGLSTAEWYGLTYDLDLGSVGALAGNVGLTVGLITAWSPTPVDLSAFIGLRLPGSSGGKQLINLQGVIKLGFDSMQFVVGQDEKGNTSYTLKLKNFALRILSIALPPGVNTEIVIFGDPDGTPQQRS